MATAAVAALGVANPVLGFALTAVATYIDQRYLLPALVGKGRSQAKPSTLVDVPVGSNDAGAPRVWAIGRRVRVPLHILWQDQKVREGTSTSSKAGTSVPWRKVYINAVLALNDRKTLAMHQMVGNGKLLVYRTRNTVEVASPNMTVSLSGAEVQLTMGSTLDPDFADRLRVDDFVEMRNFAMSVGDLNVGYWQVTVVQPHGVAPSIIRLAPRTGQSTVGLAGVAGVFPPAIVRRVDDAVIFNSPPAIISSITLPPSGALALRLDGLPQKASEVFTVGDTVIARGITAGAGEILTTTIFRVFNVGPGPGGVTMRLTVVSGPSPPIIGVAMSVLSATHWGSIQFAADNFPTRFFPATFNPDTNFQNGSSDQLEHPLISAVRGVGNSPTYRGTATQGVEGFYASEFGERLPFSMEAIIDVDPAMTWRDAMTEVLVHGGIPRWATDTIGVDTQPFDGFYIYGGATPATTMQPLLLARQILPQDRDGTICMFHVWNADVVQIENGPVFSHLQVQSPGSRRSDEKIAWEEIERTKLPTSMLVRFQDPDNVYAPGAQPFALRSPSGVDWKSERQRDFSNVVMSRKAARNLAATMLRSEWVNARTCRMQLPFAYVDLLENDILTVTDDSGEVVVCRVVERTITSEFDVNVTCVREDLRLPVAGSPVQFPETFQLGTSPYPGYSARVPVPVPGLREGEANVPGIYIGAGDVGGVWNGCHVWESRDEGATWELRTSIANPCRYGTLTIEHTQYTGSMAEPYLVETATDDITFAQVEWVSGDPPQSSALSAESDATQFAERGINLCAIEDTFAGGWEVCSFDTASHVSGNVYELSGFRRGMLGTWQYAQNGKPAGGRVVMLDSVTFLDYPGARQRKSILLKLVPPGRSLEDAEPLTVNIDGWINAAPTPPRKVTKSIDGSSNATFTVEMSGARANDQIGQTRDDTSSEPFEEYLFEIMDPGNTRVVRRKTVTSRDTGSRVLRDKFVTYSAAEQVEDGYTPGPSASFFVRCQQVGQYGKSTEVTRFL